MLRELVVSLLATYASSEYLHGSRRRAFYAGIATLAANMLALVPSLTPTLQLTSKLPIVGCAYLAAMYADTVGRNQLSRIQFLVALQAAFGRLIPLIPLLSVLIAFLFLELGELFEHVLGMSDANISELLNVPIYYGVLYGPFAFLYVLVKAEAKASTLLPVAGRSV